MMTTTMREVEVRLESGMRLRVTEQGESGAPAVVMLHGFTDSAFSFSRVLPLIGPDVHAIVPDQRGHGASDKPAGEYTLRAFASDVLELMDMLEVEQATLVGHCMGSFVAQKVAAMAPGRVRRLVLVASGATIRTPAIVGFAEAVEELGDTMPEDFVRDFQTGTVHGQVPGEFMDQVVRESLKVPAKLWKTMLSRMLEPEWGIDLAGIRSPALVVWGDHDQIFSRLDQEVLVRLIPQATLRIYEGAGHSPHWEIPAAFANDLARFMK